MNERDDGWDLSGLLETVEPPANGLTQLRRRFRRRRWGTRAVTAVVVAGVVASVVGFVVPGGGGPTNRQVVVAGPPTTQPAPPSSDTTTPMTTPAPQAAAPVIAPAPASAAPGSKPFDIAGLRLWLPASWLNSGNVVCGSQTNLQFELTPCSAVGQATPSTSLTVYLPPAPAPTSSPRTVVNGLTVEEGFGSPATKQWYFPDLQMSLTAMGSDAGAVAATAQASPGEDLMEASATLPATAPAGWQRVAFDGLAFAVPAGWQVNNPAVGGCSLVPENAVNLGQPTDVPSCPAFPPVAAAPAEDGVSVVPGPDTGQPVLGRSTSAGGALVAFGGSSVGSISGSSAVAATVAVGSKAFTVLIGVGQDPQVAWNILGSMAPTASTAQTPSSCVPGGEHPVPMPAVSTLDQQIEPQGRTVLLEPPPSGVHPAISAEQAWNKAGIKAPAGATYLLFLAQYSYPAPNGTVPPDAAYQHVLAWVIYGQNEKTQTSGCETQDSLTEIDATSGDSFGGADFAPAELPPGALVTPTGN